MDAPLPGRPKRLSLLVAGLLVAASLASGASAQQLFGPAPVPPRDIPNPPPGQIGGPVETQPLAPPADMPPIVAAPPFAPPAQAGLPPDVTPFAPPGLSVVPNRPNLPTFGHPGTSQLELSARLTADGPPVRSGLVWRIFAEMPRPDGTREMIAETQGGGASLQLKPGVYYIYCGFGYTGVTDRVQIGNGLREKTVVLNAGGLRLAAVTGKDQPVNAAEMRYDIYAQETDGRGEPKAVARDIKSGEIVRLNAGTYNVTANYGEANATTSAEVEVKAGKLSDVTLTEKAARMMMKLVRNDGGEAIADTSWTILTPSGDVVTTGVGAFPSFVLAEGDYTVVARHENQTFQRLVTVQPGKDGEVEVLAEGGETLTE